MELAALLQTAVSSPEVLGSILVLLTAYAIRLFLPGRGKKVDNSPLIGKPGDTDFHAALDNGYKKVPSSSALIWL